MSSQGNRTIISLERRFRKKGTEEKEGCSVAGEQATAVMQNSFPHALL